MRLLLDSSIWGPTSVALRADGHDVDWVGDWPSDPGDRVILDFAFADNRVLVTLDHDFGELAARRGVPHHGIIRLTATPVAREADICSRAIEAYAEELSAGAIVTASPRRMRIRLARQDESD